MAADTAGNIYVTVGNSVESITDTGAVKLVAGSLLATGSADGNGGAALFDGPGGIATDKSGNIYVADTGNNSVRKVTAFGSVTTLAGLVKGSADGTGVSAQFNATKPSAVAVDDVGNVYVADTGNNELRRVTPVGVTTTLLSGTSLAFANEGSNPSTYTITGVAVDSSGSPCIGVDVSVPFGLGLEPAEYVAVLKVTGLGSYVLLYQIPEVADLISFSPGDGSLAVDSHGGIHALCGATLTDGVNSISIPEAGPLNGAFPVAVTAASGGRFYVANPPSQSVITLSPVGTLPNIAIQPLGVTIAFGADAILSVSASGTPAPAYQWQVNGNAISGATAPSYETSVPGSYSVVVTNLAGSVTSNSAVVTAQSRLDNISSRTNTRDVRCERHLGQACPDSL